MKSRIFGLTGGIASGKSFVTKLFRAEGIPMVDADVVARELVAPGGQVLSLLVSAFGREILLQDGSLDRPRLGSIVFLDPKKRALLDSIMHRFLLDGIKEQARAAAKDHPLVGVDAALLVEKNLHQEYRPLIVVTTSLEVQVRRVMARDGFNEAEARARISSQLPLEEKVKLADYVIRNEDTLDDLTQQALRVLAHLRTH